MEVKQYMMMKTLRFVAIKVAKNTPMGTNRTPIPKL